MGRIKAPMTTLCKILTKIASESQTNWEEKLNFAFWAYEVAYKIAMGASPFELVFGLNSILLIDFLVPTLRLEKEFQWRGVN